MAQKVTIQFVENVLKTLNKHSLYTKYLKSLNKYGVLDKNILLKKFALFKKKKEIMSIKLKRSYI